MSASISSGRESEARPASRLLAATGLLGVRPGQADAVNAGAVLAAFAGAGGTGEGQTYLIVLIGLRLFLLPQSDQATPIQEILPSSKATSSSVPFLAKLSDAQPDFATRRSDPGSCTTLFSVSSNSTSS